MIGSIDLYGTGSRFLSLILVGPYPAKAIHPKLRQSAESSLTAVLETNSGSSVIKFIKLKVW